MSTWVIISWVLVFILTAINVVVFLKLKQASEQMLKMAFPNAKNMGEALNQMQGMMGAMGGAPGGRPMKGFRPGKGPAAGMPGMPGGMRSTGNKNQDAQLKAAMDMLANMQKGGKR